MKTTDVVFGGQSGAKRRARSVDSKFQNGILRFPMTYDHSGSSGLAVSWYLMTSQVVGAKPAGCWRDPRSLQLLYVWRALTRGVAGLLERDPLVFSQ